MPLSCLAWMLAWTHSPRFRNFDGDSNVPLSPGQSTEIWTFDSLANNRATGWENQTAQHFRTPCLTKALTSPDLSSNQIFPIGNVAPGNNPAEELYHIHNEIDSRVPTNENIKPENQVGLNLKTRWGCCRMHLDDEEYQIMCWSVIVAGSLTHVKYGHNNFLEKTMSTGHGITNLREPRRRKPKAREK